MFASLKLDSLAAWLPGSAPAPARLPAAHLTPSPLRRLPLPRSTALLVQPLRLAPSASPAGGSASRPQLSDAPPLTTIDVPLPLTLLPPAEMAARPGSGQGAAEGAAASDGWNPFEEGSGGAAGGSGTSGGGSGSGSGSQPARAVGYLPSGDADEVALPPGLPAALQQLGLGGALGFLRLLAEQAEGDGAAEGSSGAVSGGGGGQPPQREQRWLPLALWLGMPMQPSQLCRAVCAAAQARGFLEPAALRAQREGQAALGAALAAQAAAHGACSTAFAGGGRDDDLGAYVDRPVRNLELSSGGRLAPADLGGTAEGVPLLLA